jgi:hypothetical protein
MPAIGLEWGRLLSLLYLPGEAGWVEVRALPLPGSRRMEALKAFQSWPPDFSGDDPDDLTQTGFGSEYEIYFGVMLRPQQGNSRKSALVGGSTCWMELDLAGSSVLPGVSKEEILQMPPSELRQYAAALWMDVRAECEALELMPTACVYSGQGIHVYFGLTKTRGTSWIEQGNKALAKLFKRFGAEQTVFDCTRILRIPGTQHRKNVDRVLPVELWYEAEVRIDVVAIEAWFTAEEPRKLPQAMQQAFEQGLAAWTPSANDLRLIVQAWERGDRNRKSMAVGGWLASNGVPMIAALGFIEQVCREAADDEEDNRRGAVEAAYVRFEQGLPVLGFGTLKQMLPQLEGRGRHLLGALKPSGPTAEGEADALPLMPPNYRVNEAGQLERVEITEGRLGPIEKIELYASRWLEVRGSATDLADGTAYLTLAWMLPNGEVAEQRIAMGEAVTRGGLLALGRQMAPIDELNAAKMTRYVQDCVSWNLQRFEASAVSHRLGWHGQRFVLPGGSVEVMGVAGAAWEPVGQAEGWLEAVQAILSWGVTPALVVAALSAAAPMVRASGATKNPVVALSTTSHTGKTTAVRFALSLWADPNYNEALYFDSTSRNGPGAVLMTRQDLPVAFDDHQRYQDHEVGEFLHLLAGGAEKQRSRRDGSERQARRWRGVGILTGETSALRETIGTGAVNRLLELEDLPLGAAQGPEGYARARVLEDGSSHYGTAREQLLEAMASMDVREAVVGWGGGAVEQGAPSDMQSLCGLVAFGILALGRLVDRPVDNLVESTMAYLAGVLVNQRERHGSKALRALAALRSVLAANATADQFGDAAEEIYEGNGKGLLAFKRGWVWYVNPTSREIERVLRVYGGLDAQLSEWARMGLIEVEVDKDKRRFKVKKIFRGAQSRYVGLLPEAEKEDI